MSVTLPLPSSLAFAISMAFSFVMNFVVLVVFGFLISFCAMCMFESESSFGSAFSVLGAIMSLIGFSMFTKNMVYFKRLLFNFGYFIFFIVTFVADLMVG